jgi:signal transduction histidine kinase
MVARIKEADRERDEFNRKMLSSERLAAIGTLAAGVAHEINNPLNGIDACLKRMGKIMDQPEKIKEYIESSQNSLNHMKTVTHQLLDFSRPQKYSFKKLDINGLVEKAIELVSFRLTKENIELIKNFSENLPPINGDEHHLGQLFVNLFLNSLDAIPSGGKLTVSTETDGANVIITVKDTGTGIPEDTINNIFEPFYTTKDPGKGTGLGLAVSYRIAKEHKGKFQVKSIENIGTEIALIIPI